MANNGCNEQLNLPLHPGVEQFIPQAILQPRPGSMVDMTIQRYEEEELDDDEHDNDHEMEGGVDMTRYTDFTLKSPLDEIGNERAQSSSYSSLGEEDRIDHTRLYTTLGHSILRQRNLNLLAQNQHEISVLQENQLQELDTINNDMIRQINMKRKMIDEVDEDRKRRQINEYAPVNEYLENRWKQGINTAVEIVVDEADRQEK